MNLGIIYENKKIVNHRSLLKVIINPILRIFGWQIATCFDEFSQKLGKICLIKCEKRKLKWEKYDLTGKILIKERRWI